MIKISNTMQRILLTAAVAVYGVLVPYLELNSTHVFNPMWPSHAKLHEVWQLGTNSMIAAMCVGLAWVRQQIRLASVIGILVPLAFLVSYFTADGYGGSMRHTDGTELTINGYNASLVVMLLCFLALAFVATTSSPSSENQGD